MKYETIYDLLKDILEHYNRAESDEWVILSLCAEDIKDIVEDMEVLLRVGGFRLV